MYKNFNLTDEERKQILESHSAHGYKKPMNEAPLTNVISKAVKDIASTQQTSNSPLSFDCKAKRILKNETGVKFNPQGIAIMVDLFCNPKYRAAQTAPAKAVPSGKPAVSPKQQAAPAKTTQQAVVSEQESNPFRVGQTVKAIRDKDNKLYTIQIAKIGGAYIGGKITGPGKYQDQPLDGTVTYELTSNQSGQLSGNMDMGVFKITQ